MTQRLDLTLSPSGGNAVRTIAITGEVIEFHKRKARDPHREPSPLDRPGLGVLPQQGAAPGSGGLRRRGWLARG